MIKNDKRSIRYAEKLAFALYDMGITTADGLHDYFRAEEENKKTESLVRAMFGMSGRALTATESKYLKAWISKMGYGVEVIRLAYDITVDIKHEPIPAYANAILKKWNELGLHTENEVKAYLEESKKQKGDAKKEDAKNGASFDTEDFFDAALRRTFDEL
jgi:DnaD/phage-associated family protein